MRQHFRRTRRREPKPRPPRRTGRSDGRPRPGCRCSGSSLSACTWAAFPLAVLLMLTPAGLTIFRSYVTGLIWLQSWGPLYAILHRISMGEAAERMQAAALMPNGDVGISLVAQAGIRAVAADVAVMSGYLSMSVPFLAAALAYGLSKATVLATSVLAVGQDAATSAAHEGDDRQPLARQHAVGHAPVREPGGPSAPDLDARRHRPVHGLRPGGCGLHDDAGRHRRGGHGECHEAGCRRQGCGSRSRLRSRTRRAPPRPARWGGTTTCRRPRRGRPRPRMPRSWWSGTRTT